MNAPNLRLALAGMTLSAALVLQACSGDGGSGAGDGGGGGDDGTTSSGASSGSSSGAGSSSGGFASSGGTTSSSGAGGSSGAASSASSSGIVYTCTGCIDTSGRCNDGGANDRCGHNSSTCQDCTTYNPPEVCGASGDCVPASAGGSSSGSGGTDAGGG